MYKNKIIIQIEKLVYTGICPVIFGYTSLKPLASAWGF